MQASLRNLAAVRASERRELARRATIANGLRRAWREVPGPSELRERLLALVAAHAPRKQVQASGRELGLRERPQNLADVLWSVQEAGLGRAAVVEESNRHLVVRVSDCLSGRERLGMEGCEFVAGYLAGCLLATGRYAAVDVTEVACLDGTGAELQVRAELRLK